MRDSLLIFFAILLITHIKEFSNASEGNTHRHVNDSTPLNQRDPSSISTFYLLTCDVVFDNVKCSDGEAFRKSAKKYKKTTISVSQKLANLLQFPVSGMGRFVA